MTYTGPKGHDKPKYAGPKTYAKSVKIRIGVLSIEGALMPIQATAKAPKVSLVAPGGGGVAQVYQGEDGTVYERDDLERKITDGDEEIVVSAAQLAEAKEKALNKAKNVLSLVVHDAEAEQYMFPHDSKGYVFVPHTDDPENLSWYGVFRYIMENTDKIFVGEAKISRSTGFFRAMAWNGQIIIQKYSLPKEINHYDPIEAGPSEYGEKFVAKLDKLSVPFDPEAYTDIMGDALRNADSVQIEEKPSAADIGGALDAFLEDL